MSNSKKFIKIGGKYYSIADITGNLSPLVDPETVIVQGKDYLVSEIESKIEPLSDFVYRGDLVDIDGDIYLASTASFGDGLYMNLVSTVDGNRWMELVKIDNVSSGVELYRFLEEYTPDNPPKIYANKRRVVRGSLYYSLEAVKNNG